MNLIPTTLDVLRVWVLGLARVSSRIESKALTLIIRKYMGNVVVLRKIPGKRAWFVGQCNKGLFDLVTLKGEKLRDVIEKNLKWLSLIVLLWDMTWVLLFLSF